MSFKILALDGGGVFGVGQALILSQLDNSKWDAVCGTSIGSCVAAAIATNKKVNVEFFRKNMPIIFRNHWYVNPLTGSRYSDTGLNQSLNHIFGSDMMKDVDIPLFITAASIDQHCPKTFSSGNIEDGNMLVSDVVRCSCAAPTYFKPWLGYGDGGVFANNPSMVAVTRAMKEFELDLEEIELCSIGTGTFSRSDYNRGDHILFWTKWLTTSLFEGGSDKLFDDMASALPLKRYERYQFVKRSNWHMDSIENMKEAINDWSGQALYYSKHIKENFLTDNDNDGSVLDLNQNEQENIKDILKNDNSDDE